MIDITVAEQIRDSVDALRDDLIQCLQELVRIPSVVGDEAQCQEYMEQLYRSLGLSTQAIQADRGRLSGHPAFIDTGKDYENRPNVVGTLYGENGHNSLVVNGHVDVVSPEPKGAWTRDPWGGDIEGDRLYGRGAGDMKAGLIANAFALKAIQASGLQPAGTLILQSVVDEEAGGGGGTLTCLMAGNTADAFLCTEPHGFNVTVAHAGISHFRIRVAGRTAHGGLAQEGINAIGKFIPIYQALEKLDRKRGLNIHNALFDKGSGRSCHLSVGTIRGGDWPSTVTGEVEVECRISFIPGESLIEIRKLVEETVYGAIEHDPWFQNHPPIIEWFGWQTEPWQQDSAHPFVQKLKAAAEMIAGKPIDFIGRASGLDTRFAEHFDMPAACIGPIAGNIHGPDEYVGISSVIEISKIVALTILEWCGHKQLRQ